MNNLSAASKLVIVLLVMALLATLGTCTARTARRSVRVRRESCATLEELTAE